MYLHSEISINFQKLNRYRERKEKGRMEAKSRREGGRRGREGGKEVIKEWMDTRCLRKYAHNVKLENL